MNVYPMVRGFTAIGIGGDDFVQAMVGAVESVIETQIPEVLMSDKKIDTLLDCRDWISTFPEILFDKGTWGFDTLITWNNE